MSYNVERDTYRIRWDTNFSAYTAWVKQHDGKLPAKNSKDLEENFLYTWMKSNKARFAQGKLEQRRIFILNNFNPTILNKEGMVNSVTKQETEDESLLNKGLTKQQLDNLSKIGVTSMPKVIKALKSYYTLGLKQQRESLTAREHLTYAKISNAFDFLRQYSSETYPCKFVYSLFKMRDPHISFGTMLTITAIEDGNIGKLIFSSEYNYTGLNVRTERALYRLTSQENTVMLHRYYHATVDNRPTQKDTARKYKVGFEKVKQAEASALRKLREPKLLNEIKQFETDINN